MLYCVLSRGGVLTNPHSADQRPCLPHSQLCQCYSLPRRICSSVHCSCSGQKVSMTIRKGFELHSQWFEKHRRELGMWTDHMAQNTTLGTGRRTIAPWVCAYTLFRDSKETRCCPGFKSFKIHSSHWLDHAPLRSKQNPSPGYHPLCLGIGTGRRSNSGPLSQFRFAMFLMRLHGR
jgi:hypothetical protein